MAVGAVGLLAAGCSSSKKTPKPTAAKPSEPPIRRVPPGARKPYPNLASVPNKRPKIGTTQQRLEIEQGLYADRRNARHVDGPQAGDEERGRTATTGGQKVTPRVITPVRAGRNPGGGRRAVRQVRRPSLALRVRRGGYVTTIFFPNDATTLPPGGGRLIVQVAELHRYTGGTVRVVGHAIKGGSAAKAAARAKVVSNGLISLGVPRARIRAASAGDRQARYKDNNKNSRVDIFITGARRR
jgi:outer membrane protein OmpA-like peptidoglycan-associated protein